MSTNYNLTTFLASLAVQLIGYAIRGWVFMIAWGALYDVSDNIDFTFSYSAAFLIAIIADVLTFRPPNQD